MTENEAYLQNDLQYDVTVRPSSLRFASKDFRGRKGLTYGFEPSVGPSARSWLAYGEEVRDD